MKKYADIIDLSWSPKNHPRMSIENRAAQFAPFSALSGYAEAVREKSRLTDRKVELTDEEKAEINFKILDMHEKGVNVIVTYFIPDEFKKGGRYACQRSKIKRVDTFAKILILENGEKISIEDIRSIEEE